MLKCLTLAKFRRLHASSGYVLRCTTLFSSQGHLDCRPIIQPESLFILYCRLKFIAEHLARIGLKLPVGTGYGVASMYFLPMCFLISFTGLHRKRFVQRLRGIIRRPRQVNCRHAWRGRSAKSGR